MENIAESVKMAGAALIFVLLLTVTLTLYRQARDTADYILEASDKTTYYQHIGTNIDDNKVDNVSRVVGIETIIPTLYTYCQTDGPTIIIKDNEGELIQIFDDEFDSVLKTDNMLYSKYASDYGTAPWSVGSSGYDRYLERINAFLYGKKINYNGWYYNSVGNTKDGDVVWNFVEKYGDKEFIETYQKYYQAGEYVKDENSGTWYTLRDGEEKAIITYTLMD